MLHARCEIFLPKSKPISNRTIVGFPKAFRNPEKLERIKLTTGSILTLEGKLITSSCSGGSCSTASNFFRY